MIYVKGMFSTVLLLLLLTDVTVTSATAADAQKPAQKSMHSTKVEGLTAVQQGDAISLRWQAIDGCDGYRVYHETGDRLRHNSAWYDVDSSQTASLFLDVIAGGKYTFCVSALYGKREEPRSTRVTVQMTDRKKASGPSDTAK